MEFKNTTLTRPWSMRTTTSMILSIRMISVSVLEVVKVMEVVLVMIMMVISDV